MFFFYWIYDAVTVVLILYFGAFFRWRLQMADWNLHHLVQSKPMCKHKIQEAVVFFNLPLKSFAYTMVLMVKVMRWCLFGSISVFILDNTSVIKLLWLSIWEIICSVHATYICTSSPSVKRKISSVFCPFSLWMGFFFLYLKVKSLNPQLHR